MINVVVGLPRSGTTATMKALEAGGLSPVRTPRPRHGVPGMFDKSTVDPALIAGLTPAEHLRLREDVSRYRFYEPSPEQVYAEGFPFNHPDESVVKMILEGSPRTELPTFTNPILGMTFHQYMARGEPGYRVLMIYRHPREIRVSNEDSLDWGGGALASVGYLTDEWYGRAMGEMARYLRSRTDVHSFTKIQYAPNFDPHLPALLGDQVEIFEGLAAEGWPIDAAAAAATIDPTKRSVREEDLPLNRAVA